MQPTVLLGNVTGGVNDASRNQMLQIESIWNLHAGETVKLYAFFDDVTGALTGVQTGDRIPASAILGAWNCESPHSFSSRSLMA